ncbi:MAG TPA: hypothetical protein VMC84_04525 [Methanocella sp.]|uniref:hypothetical protein n=1 Tax=Methanocella sp. TaxID=2052833 RepID=UPI002BA2DE08|nr:hypothetical protein [Methanocella sp.]HTY90421.1 hypothetical protein [Methanocella sp.]
MSRADTIGERLPHFYLTWNGQTAIAGVIKAVGKTMDETEKDFGSIMASHWVDTASGEELDRLGGVYSVRRKAGESDMDFRGRLKTSIISYRGGGTLGSLRMMTRIALGLPADHPIEILENPPTQLKQTWKASANNEWSVNPRNIDDATLAITMTVETPGARVTDPTITNVDTGEYMTFKGSLAFGDVLRLADGKASLNGQDVTERLSPASLPRLPRKKTRWRYREAVEANIGVFDSTRFDQSVFAVNIMTAITFEWTARQPAFFEVRIPGDIIARAGVTREYVQELVNSVKACGVRGQVVVV